MKQLFLILSIFLGAALTADAARAKPNIVFILVDDMGYGDIACYGAPDAKTPVLDKLADSGVKFTQFYANGAECTPTRTSIMTGRYPQRIGGLECAIGTGNVGRYDDAIRLANNGDLGLPAAESLLAMPFKRRGYKTAVFGKWHLGYERKFLPDLFGFDRSFYFLGGNVDYFTHKELSPLPALYEGSEPVKRDGYMTHLITDNALEFIRDYKSKPFFLYVPYSTPHFPFQAPGDAKKVFTKENWLEGTRATYVKMLEDMDAQVGKILTELDAHALAEDTVVVFASDHGAMKPGINAPFNGWKGGLFEGGIRAPLIVRWPGRIAPGTVSHQVAMSMDLTASFLRIAGTRPPPGIKLDGIDIIDHVEKKTPDFDRTVFWRARRGDRTWRAVRDGGMKYIYKIEGGKEEEWLFDLKADQGETTNLIDTRSPVLLKSLLLQWESRVRPTR
jgi:N-acetylgalactosamine-6-sulfatase